MNKQLSDIKGETPGLSRELGLISATAIVVGNTVGSGIFMSPQSLAATANPKATMLAWIITSIGSILLALSFAKLGTAMPQTGGPIVYTRVAFGEFAGFLIAWTYWIGIWVGDAAIITAAISYLSYFLPILTDNRLLAFLASSFILWFFTLINIKGVKEAGLVSIVTSVCKIVPLLIFAAITAMHFNAANFNTVSSPKVSGLATVPAAVSITLWSFLGLESATVSGGEIKNPEKNIKISTILGTVISALIYIVLSALAIGAMSQEKLAATYSPLADIIDYVTGGTWGGTLITIGALIATIGTISGWIMLTARCAYAAAEDNLFPSCFKKIHPKYKTPYVGLIISSIGTNILLITNYVSTLTEAFNFILLLSTLAILPIYTFASAADIMLLTKRLPGFNMWSFLKNSFLALVAFGYSLYAIYGTGSQVVMYGFLLLLLGIPVYVYMKLKNGQVNEVY